MLELWGQGQTYEELHEAVRSVPASVTHPHFVIDKSFRVYVETFCKTISHEEKVDKIEVKINLLLSRLLLFVTFVWQSFSYLPVEGPVSLTNPDVKLYLLEYYGLDPNNIPEEPYQMFFGRWVSHNITAL